MANFGINDIAKVTVSITGAFGNFVVRTYGESPSSIILNPADNGSLYYAKYGSGGQALFSKNYKPKNFEMTLNILRLSQDYANFQKIVEIEVAGGQAVFSCTYLDENSGETVTSNTCVLMTQAPVETGADINADATYVIAMSDATYTPPTGSIIG